MDAKLKECAHCGSPARLLDHRTIFAVECTSAACAALVLGDRAPEPDGEMGDAYWAAYQQTAIDRWNARSIAPPVAAGSVDTLKRFELVESQHGTGYMVHWDKAMEEDDDGEWAKHADAIVWGAQQRHEGFQEGVAQLQQERDNLLKLAASRREWAEKAEARAAHLENYFKHHSVQVPPQYTALHTMEDSSADKK